MNAMPEAIVVVDPIFSGAPLCEAVRAEGYALIGVVSLPQQFFRPPLRMPDRDRFDLLIHDADERRVTDALRRSGLVIAAVIAGAEAGVLLADRLGQALGVRHNDMAMPNARRNKYDMKLAARAAGLDCAAACRCFSLDDAQRFAGRIGYPVMLKTPAGAATSQVFKCADPQSLRAAFEHIVNRPNLFCERSDHALAEEYLHGTEYIVDMFSDDSGVHVTDVWRYVKVPGPNGDTLYFDTIQGPADAPALAPLRDYACRLARAVGILYGPSHAEIKATPRGPVMVEIAARPAGGQIPLLLRRTSNFDLYRAAVAAHLRGSADFDWPIRHHGSAWLVHEPVPCAGIVRAIDGMAAIQALPSYVSHSLNVAPGDHVRASESLHDMALLLCLSNADRAILGRDAAAAHDLFQLRIEASQEHVPCPELQAVV